MHEETFGPVAAIAPQSVTWFGVDLTGGVADASSRSSWTIEGRPVPFVPPVPGVGFEQTERGLRSVGIYAAALEQAEAVAAAAIPVERAAGPLLLLSGGDDGACPSTLMARMIVERMEAHDRGAAVRHLDSRDAATSSCGLGLPGRHRPCHSTTAAPRKRSMPRTTSPCRLSSVTSAKAVDGAPAPCGQVRLMRRFDGASSPGDRVATHVRPRPQLAQRRCLRVLR